MSSIRRSRSPRYRREYPLSSSGGNDSYASNTSRKQSKPERDRRNNSRDQVKERATDVERKRSSAVERGNEKYNEYDSYFRTNEKFRGVRAESPEEESYLKPMSNFQKEHATRTVNTDNRGTMEDCMRDPSTCDFRGSSHSTSHTIIIDDINLPGKEEPVRIEEPKVKDDTGNRLERLEKLVELLVNNNTKSHPIQVNKPQENVYELVPRDVNFTTSMWLNKVHDECIERNYDEKTTIQFLENNMTGIIKAWYKTIPSYDFSWPELKMLITKTFPDHTDFASTLRLLVERKKKQEESVTQYYFSKMYLLEACKISGTNAVSCLIDGLENESFRQEAKGHNFLTPEALYSQFLLKFTFYHQPQDIQETTDYQEVYDMELEHVENDMSYKIRNKNTPRNAKKCFTCKKVGHLGIDCRHAPCCYVCKNGGHIAANCPLKFRKVLMISNNTDELDDSNYLSCYVNGKKLQAYIDTGCNAITIKERVAQDLKLKFNSSQQILQGYGGGIVRALGVVKLVIKVDLVECMLPAVVVPDDVQTAALIIGKPLLYKQDVVMVLHNNGIRLFEKNLHKSHLKTILNDFDSLQECY